MQKMARWCLGQNWREQRRQSKLIPTRLAARLLQGVDRVHDVRAGDLVAVDLVWPDVFAKAEALSAAGVKVRHLRARGHTHTSLTSVGMVFSGAPVRAEMAAAIRGFFGAKVSA